MNTRVVWSVVLMGCGGPRSSPPEPLSPAVPASSTIVVGGQTIGGGGLSTGCEGCHAEIAAEWRDSYHRVSFTDETFQHSLALEEPQERAFCVGCHAPEAQAAGVSVGVGCASCHAQPHAGAKARDTCDRCHQFGFDDGRADLVQRTRQEHAQSWFSTASCEDCHMPYRQGASRHRDHRFVSAHSVTQLRAAVRLEVRREGPRAVRVRVESYAGHAFPTGDMFRRARLLLFAERDDGAVIDSHEHVFGRTWGEVPSGPHAGRRRELADTRLRGEHHELVEFDTEQPIAQVRYELRFERVLSVRAEEPTLVSSDAIAEGVAR